MSHYGDLAPSSVLYFKFTTADATGLAITLAGTPALSCYKDDDLTQSTTGITLTVDHDGRTGTHQVKIDTSADGTFYAADHDFQVEITTGTVNSISVVGKVVGSFSLNHRSALRPTTAGRTLDVSATGEAGLDWANIGSATTTVGLSGTTVKTATDVETDTADIQARLPAALTADGNVKADTLRVGGTLQTARDIGASVLLSTGTGTGQLDFTSGVVKANLAQILGTALTETAGLLAGGFKKFLNVVAPTGTLNSLPDAVPDAAGGLPVTGNRLTAIPTVAAVTTVTNLTNAPTAGDLTATMKTSVNTEVVDALAVDTYAEPGQANPAATTTLAVKVNYIYKAFRNLLTQTSTTLSIYNDAGTTVDQKATVSDDGTTYTRGKIGTGP